jgi:DNA mismatch repair protein MutS
LRNLVANCVGRLQATAAALAQLDALASLADLARARNYCRPKLVESAEISIVDGRHPVLDSLLSGGAFVPNDTLASPDDGLILLITGPNMAGKSTYIRQVALITLMAQIGSFVPAREATLGLADRIFARVGASDELSRGQSTFMVEMVETARILNTATPRSLVILDEIGRGTSTYDGVSLAWAVVEYLHDHIGCRTLFATHYHELTDLAKTLSSVRNLNVAVREWEDQVVFLHKIVEGAADKSYGIHVARLAGVPREVNQRAKQILAQLEQEHLDDDGRPKMSRRGKSHRVGDLQLTLFAAEPHPIVEKLRTLDLNTLSPLAAMQMLHEWQNEIGDSQLKSKST